MKSPFATKLLTYKRVGIDSMCFIYQFEGNKNYGTIVKDLFLLLQNQKLTAVTSVLTLAEILAFEKVQQDKIIFDQTKVKLHGTPNLRIIPIDETISETAAILKYRYTLTLPDALQLATAIISNQDVFVSNDRRFHRIKEIPILLLDDFLTPTRY